MKTMRVPAEWTDDCQGKKDYDGELVSLSTRYWPRGGSHAVIQPGVGVVSDTHSPERQHIRPHASASIYLGSTANAWYDKAVLLAECDFEAETQVDVQLAVEKWAAEQFARIEKVLRAEFAR